MSNPVLTPVQIIYEVTMPPFPGWFKHRFCYSSHHQHKPLWPGCVGCIKWWWQRFIYLLVGHLKSLVVSWGNSINPDPHQRPKISNNSIPNKQQNMNIKHVRIIQIGFTLELNLYIYTKNKIWPMLLFL